MKNVLLTGATRGLGLAIANRLAADGYRVLTTGRRLTPELDSLMKREGGVTTSFSSPLILRTLKAYITS